MHQKLIYTIMLCFILLLADKPAFAFKPQVLGLFCEGLTFSRMTLRRYISKEVNMVEPINETIARTLVKEQFSWWGELKISSVETSGWDNRTFRLGEEYLLRFPSALVYVSQVEKEQKWLPKLAPHLPVKIPTPLALGQPGHGYPWLWSIYNWIPGNTLVNDKAVNKIHIAEDFAKFLTALHNINTEGGPKAGKQNFYRGSHVSVYEQEIRRACERLEAQGIATNIARQIWCDGMNTEWMHPPVWVHGDTSPNNILTSNGKLNAVIDFGQLGVGDPACDLVMAWTYFDSESRNIFRKSLSSIDQNTWKRAKAWALWKAVILTSGITNSYPFEISYARQTLNRILEDSKTDSTTDSKT